MGLLGPLAVLFVIARVVLKKLSSSSSSASTTGLRGADLASALSGSAPGSKAYRKGLTARLGIDGFWIEGPVEAAGQVIRYQYVVSGQTFANEVIYSPGPDGQFVFTGGTPTSASVMISGGATGTTDDSDWTGRSLSSNQSHHSSSSSSHFPSAY
jgi:formylglycine-generating enzyme